MKVSALTTDNILSIVIGGTINDNPRPRPGPHPLERPTAPAPDTNDLHGLFAISVAVNVLPTTSAPSAHIN